jgi:hypothetical protein
MMKNLLVLTVTLGILSSMTSAEMIWIEGEKPLKHTMNRHPWWYDRVKKTELSGGDWISNYSKDKQGTAFYGFKIQKSGDYNLWLRANPVSSAMSFKIDQSAWTPVEMTEGSYHDKINIAADDKPDLRFIAWINVGTLSLKAGVHRITFKTHSKNDNHGGIDCFVLTDTPFTPKGNRKPGEPKPVTATKEGSWAFEPDPDTYSDKAIFDLRSLNETVAGESGFIGLSKDGSDFVKGDGTAIRFWAVNSYTFSKGQQALADNARFLAKRGVNIVRWHGQICSKDKDSQINDIDTKAREELWQYVAAMKKEGIYMTLSPYYAMPAKTQPKWGVPYEGSDMHAMLFFNPKLQLAYKSWLRAIFEPTNPYTGIALKDDPAVAIIQLQNEDSLLFWTVANLKGKDLDLLCSQYAQWLVKKYGSVNRASAAWDNTKVEGDNLDGGIVRFCHIWEMTQPQKENSGREQRLADQTQFWTETMYRFNIEMSRFLREEIGAKQLINPSNWKSADSVKLNDAERYSYTANEVMAVNSYYNGGQHMGANSGWAIVNGDRFTNISVLLDPRSMPLNIKQVANHPMLITESSWVPPLGYQSEGPFLVSVFQSLCGIDGFYWFAMGESQWRQPASANGYLPSIGKWVINTPQLMGNFPAAALMYRKGYIKRAKPVVSEKRSLEDIWKRRAPIIAESPTYDPNRDKNISKHSNIKSGVNPLAFLVGPVEVQYDADPRQCSIIDLDQFIDEDKKTIRSVTNQVKWDYIKGICTIDSPYAQGATGFLKKDGEIELSGTSLETTNEYITVLIVSLDENPIASSEKILIQAGTIARPKDWSQKALSWEDKDGNTHMGFEVTNYGKAPWIIEENRLAVSIRNKKIKKATVLDMNHLPRGDVKLNRTGSTVKLEMPKDAMYLILE